jgi:hypothetical protein
LIERQGFSGFSRLQPTFSHRSCSLSDVAYLARSRRSSIILTYSRLARRVSIPA